MYFAAADNGQPKTCDVVELHKTLISVFSYLKVICNPAVHSNGVHIKYTKIKYSISYTARPQ